MTSCIRSHLSVDDLDERLGRRLAGRSQASPTGEQRRYERRGGAERGAIVLPDSAASVEGGQKEASDVGSAAAFDSIATLGLPIMRHKPELISMSQPVQSLAIRLKSSLERWPAENAFVVAATNGVPTRKASTKNTFATRVRHSPRMPSVCDHGCRSARQLIPPVRHKRLECDMAMTLKTKSMIVLIFIAIGGGATAYLRWANDPALRCGRMTSRWLRAARRYMPLRALHAMVPTSKVSRTGRTVAPMGSCRHRRTTIAAIRGIIRMPCSSRSQSPACKAWLAWTIRAPCRSSRNACPMRTSLPSSPSLKAGGRRKSAGDTRRSTNRQIDSQYVATWEG